MNWIFASKSIIFIHLVNSNNISVYIDEIRYVL